MRFQVCIRLLYILPWFVNLRNKSTILDIQFVNMWRSRKEILCYGGNPCYELMKVVIRSFRYRVRVLWTCCGCLSNLTLVFVIQILIFLIQIFLLWLFPSHYATIFHVFYISCCVWLPYPRGELLSWFAFFKSKYVIILNMCLP